MAPRATRRVSRPDSAARLRALTRRAYTATSGHLDLDDEAGREFDRIVSGDERPVETRARRTVPSRRWAVSGRAVVVVLAVVAAFAGAVVARAIALGPSDAVPVPQLSAEVPPEPSTAGPPADLSPGPADLPPGDEPEPDDAEPGGPEGSPPAADASVVVHVAGAVREPGVVELPASARVADAVAAAGGADTEAELGAVNLARPVLDGEQVYVPRVGEVEPGPAAAAPPGAAAGTGPPAAADAAGGGVVDLNTADLAALDTLPGVGPAIAQRILDWREANGSFHSVEELLEVSGIGPATLERLRELVRV